MTLILSAAFRSVTNWNSRYLSSLKPSGCLFLVFKYGPENHFGLAANGHICVGKRYLQESWMRQVTCIAQLLSESEVLLAIQTNRQTRPVAVVFLDVRARPSSIYGN